MCSQAQFLSAVPLYSLNNLNYKYQIQSVAIVSGIFILLPFTPWLDDMSLQGEEIHKFDKIRRGFFFLDLSSPPVGITSGPNWHHPSATLWIITHNIILKLQCISLVCYLKYGG